MSQDIASEKIAPRGKRLNGVQPSTQRTVDANTPVSKDYKPRGKRGKKNPLKVVRPDIELPDKESRPPHLDVIPLSIVKKNQPNALGLQRTAEDVCHNLSHSRGGVCVIQGQKPCAFLGGNQETCELFKTKAEGVNDRNRQLNREERIEESVPQMKALEEVPATETKPEAVKQVPATTDVKDKQTK